jgi:hypothetical protein
MADGPSERLIIARDKARETLLTALQQLREKVVAGQPVSSGSHIIGPDYLDRLIQIIAEDDAVRGLIGDLTLAATIETLHDTSRALMFRCSGSRSVRPVMAP